MSDFSGLEIGLKIFGIFCALYVIYMSWFLKHLRPTKR